MAESKVKGNKRAAKKALKKVLNSLNLKHFSLKQLHSLNRRKLLSFLKKCSVSNVKISRDLKKISLNFLGKKIFDKILVQWEPNVGEWSRKRKEVIVDRDILKSERNKSFKSLCVHEAVEKFVGQEFHLKTDDEAHPIARAVERKYLKSIGGNWRSHQLIVYWDWHKHGEH